MRVAAWIAVVFAVLVSVTAAFACVYYYNLTASVASTHQALTTDQILASLSTNVTILGALIAVGGIAVGMIALFGYAELRTSTMRKTEDDLVKIIQGLQKSGELGTATAMTLIEVIAPGRVVAPPSASNVSGPNASKSAEGTQSERVAAKYPEEDQNESAR
jgi:hypothetical protein